jgi:hypothetical protein
MKSSKEKETFALTATVIKMGPAIHGQLFLVSTELKL